MNTVEILKAARELISDEKNWTIEDYARGAGGEFVGCLESRASCFCAIGALARVQGVDPDDDVPGAAELAHIITGGASGAGYLVAHFNDSHTHSEVLALFDSAIARAEGGAA